MIIDIASLRKHAIRLQGETPVQELDLGADPFVRPADNLVYDLTVECVGDETLVRGALALDMECLCARCGAWFRHRLTAPDFTRTFHLPGAAAAIDLTLDMREDIILAFPSNWLCRPDCRGVCSGCGANLNAGACDCGRRRHDAVPEAWDSLEKIIATPDTARIKDIMEDKSDGGSKT